ncbi:hypothetical protein OG205_11285 [Lentzea sp. NBC_00516]|uniref:hypothetical protein n=1 Tax=Lentzea sp. NBC_00516 TaxID=2903582 RepID=UPI002E7FB618|nr:hypothetical protein [Lentzea sp. NBC_00516]WUD27546.1 hypothetical protein OG205_11285 [Lentzea sp. NBC_00516]
MNIRPLPLAAGSPRTRSDPREAISVATRGPDLLSSQLDLTSFSLSELRLLHKQDLDAAIVRTVEQARSAKSDDGIQEQRV